MLQRFISEDPIRFAGDTTNFDTYVGLNPVLKNDPSGLLGAGCALRAGVVGAIGSKKPFTTVALSTAFGCTVGEALAFAPPGAVGAFASAITGAITGALVAAATGGNPAVGTLGGFFGGGISGFFAGGAAGLVEAGVGIGLGFGGAGF